MRKVPYHGCCMRTLYCCVLLLCCACHANAENLLIKRIISVYDGDTIKVDLDFTGPAIFNHNISIRILGIDTPEIHGQCEAEKALAQKAKAWLADKLENARSVELHNAGRDKYFRVLGDLVIDGKLVSEQLIEQGLARAYDGGHKTPWCPAKNSH